MLLRPATPLSVLLSIAFALLLLSTLSTPIIKAIPLSVDQGWEFGVFGYCDTSGNNCISPHIGYSTETLFAGGSNGGDFSLPVTSRKTLSYILIVHPIAALMTLVCDILAIASHFHGPSSSAKFLLALLILTIPTLLLSLLAFLVDILLFVPHMAWGGWIVLAATILIVASSVLICAMRRTLISRKARTKRIAENSDMNGETYFNTLNNHRAMAATNDMPRADSPPPISAYDSSKNGGAFAAFDMKSHDSTGRTSEDRAPLNPSMRAGSTGPGARRPYGSEDGLPPMPINGQQGYDEHGRPLGPQRDAYGSPVSPISPDGMGMGVLNHSPSRGSLNSNGSGRGGPGYGRGRGYGPGPPRGGYGPPRGGYGPAGRGYGPPRGGYGPRGGYRGGPQNFSGRGGYGSQGGMAPRTQSPAAYNDPYYGNDRSMDGRMQDDFVARGPSPHLPIGQAIEMDERTGSPPALSYGHNSSAPMEPERSNSRSPPQDGAYVPARAAWKPMQPANEPMRFSPDNASSHYSSGRNVQLSPIQASPRSAHETRSGAQHTRGGSENYYEDVDPRFANDRSSPQQALPNSLVPGSAYNGPAPIRH